MMEYQNYPDLIIEEGHNSGSCFWIMPVKIAMPDYVCQEGERIFMGTVECFSSEISIEEENIEKLLWQFLLRHYNHALSMEYRKLSGGTEYDGFEWNLTHNVYTYEDIRKMLADIQDKVSLLKDNMDNPILEPFVKHFPAPPCNAVIGKQIIPLKRSAEEIHAYRLKYLDLFIDFYERFCKRICKMLQDNPRYNHISVMGP